jgi:hypothetical protein
MKTGYPAAGGCEPVPADGWTGLWDLFMRRRIITSRARFFQIETPDPAAAASDFPEQK